MKIEDIESVSFSREGFPPHVKSPIIWGQVGSGAAPLCYLVKPKSLPTEEWERFLDCFDFSVRKR